MQSKPEEQRESSVLALKFIIRKYFGSTLSALLLIVTITITYAVFLIADALIIYLITIVFGSFGEQNIFVHQLLEGIRIFSALGVAIIYNLHMIYSLFKEAKNVTMLIREESKEKENVL